MKFVHYLERITGVSIYPLTSLMIFIIFFICVAYYVYSAPKKDMQSKGNIPLN